MNVKALRAPAPSKKPWHSFGKKPELLYCGLHICETLMKLRKDDIIRGVKSSGPGNSNHCGSSAAPIFGIGLGAARSSQ